MPPRIDMIGKRHGRVIAIAPAPLTRWGASWLFQCDCGKQFVTRGAMVRSGNTNSCGCYHRERNSAHQYGDAKAGKIPLYQLWLTMRSRCNTPTATAYAYYGGRGIKVCERWDSFEAFRADMGQRPSQQHTLDRINGRGDYEPSNCRWATKAEQSRNSTTAKLTESSAAMIKALAAVGISRRALAKRYGVARATISGLLTGYTWKEIRPTDLTAEEAARCLAIAEGQV